MNNITRKITGVFILVSILLGMLFYIYNKNQGRAIDTNRLVAHTHDVLSKTEEVRARANELQIAVRGFIISATENDLTTFNNAADGINDAVKDLAVMTKDNSVQQLRADSLEQLAENYIRSRKELIKVRQTAGFEVSQNFIKGTDITIMSRLQAMLNTITAAENQLLAKRKIENEESIKNTSGIILLFQVLTFSLLLIALAVIYNNTKRRNKAEEENRILNATLEKRVKEKAAKIIEKEQEYRFLLENMREGIQIIGYDWKYLFVNNSVINQALYSGEELLGHTMMDKYPGIEHSELFKVLQRCMKDRTAEIIENDFAFPDGSKGYFELSIQPVPEGLFILSMDITERKRSEEKMKDYADELRASNVELERFAYVASHDLQEPLRMVTSFLTLLEKRMQGQLDETGKQYIYFAVDGAARMKTLIQDLLLYSRVGTNKEDFTAVDVNEVIQYNLRVLKGNINETGAEIIVNPLPVIKANKTLIHQLFLNLISNALKYHGEPGPQIEIGYTDEKNNLVFYIKDNGIGIDAEYFEKIFIIFQRLHNKDEYSGTGIGLAICKKIADLHKGKIWVESEEGKGSTFYFSIPKQI